MLNALTLRKLNFRWKCWMYKVSSSICWYVSVFVLCLLNEKNGLLINYWRALLAYQMVTNLNRPPPNLRISLWADSVRSICMVIVYEIIFLFIINQICFRGKKLFACTVCERECERASKREEISNHWICRRRRES